MSAPDVLIGVEDREMLPDDLLGLVALDALSSKVPCCDVPIGVEHEDGVVLDALDQEAEALFAFPENFVGRPGRFAEFGWLHWIYCTTSKSRGGIVAHVDATPSRVWPWWFLDP